MDTEWVLQGCLFFHFSFFNGSFSASFFFIFVFSMQLTVNKCSIAILPMTGFEPQTSGFESNRSTN